MGPRLQSSTNEYHKCIGEGAAKTDDTLQSLARCAHPCEVGNAIDRDEASRAADKVAFERHLDITPQILLHLGSSPCRLVIDRQRLERSVPALDMKSMSARFD